MSVFASCCGVFLVFVIAQLGFADTSAVSRLPGVSTSTVSAPTTASAAPADPAAPKPGLNQFIGTVETVDTDNKIVRLNVEGGYHVELAYNSKTATTNGGGPMTMDDLEYGDKVVVRYQGRDLMAVEIERLLKAPRAVPPAAPEGSASPAQ